MNVDVAIIGGGLAGLTVALTLADTKKVLLITKEDLGLSASCWAQGGIAAVLDSQDSFANHIEDTHVAGAHLCDPEATEFIIENGPKAIDWLIQAGVPFTRDELAEKGYHLTREGGHSHRRIIHAADATGAAVVQALTKKVLAHPNITILEQHFAIDLITDHKLGLSAQPNECYGFYVLNQETQQVITVQAQDIVLATGGLGKVYLYTSNPDTATGDGVAMAWRAGCSVANMEFIQFHPTCLYHPYAKSFLISEALRGEGAVLRLPDGTRFMPEHDAREELAPRDIVARAIDFEIKRHGIDCVYLDISHQPEAFLLEHFPTIYARCKELNIDISSQGIPVVPAAHYACGGIVTNKHGQTDIKHLYAVGESAYTGLHGANRLASNSLLECVVIGQAVAQDILNNIKASSRNLTLPSWDESQVEDPDEAVVVSHNWDELRRLMWNYVGIVRTDKRLARAKHRIQLLKDEVQEYYSNFKISRDLLELRNVLEVADLIVDSAIQRKESRGLHYSRDYPGREEVGQTTVLRPEQ